MPSIELIQQLRQQTGVGIMDASRALEEAGDDIEKALEILRKKGAATAAKKSSRGAHEGLITSYIHTGGRVGVLLKLYCETDFVAKNEEFKELAHDLAMQVAATNPQWISAEDIPAETLDKEKEIYSQNIDKAKPVEMRNKIINGKLKKFYAEVCLLSQPFIKDDKIVIQELIQNKIAKLGENIQVKRFIRFSL
ncbi:elongation factor Ts [Patescibacteria group bacterium]|nr:elongation factor Ts [Patescibacteria group bacterium]